MREENRWKCESLLEERCKHELMGCVGLWRICFKKGDAGENEGEVVGHEV